MSLSICADCLSRLRISSKLPTTLAAAVTASKFLPRASSFHSSAVQYKSPLKKKANPLARQVDQKTRRSTTLRLKKKTRVREKPPPVGERKAQRRRIVLSNTNALEVLGLEDVSPANMGDAQYKGKVLGLEGGLLDQLRDSKAFKTTQNWNLFRRPATLMRSETIGIAKDVEDVNNSRGKKTVRHLITGDKHSGKSILMLQAMSMAFMHKWVVINVPEGQELTNSTSSYAPLATPDTSHTSNVYIQPHMTQLLLTRAAYSNDSVLAALPLKNPLPPSLRLKKSATLKDLAMLGADDHTLAYPVWQAFWREVNAPGRPPILLAVDGADHWMGLTKYRSADYEILHAHQFALIRQFTELLFSKTPLTNGGMVLFSTSGSNTPSFPTFNLLMNQLRARQAGVALTAPEFPMPKPFSRPDTRVLDLFAGSEDVKLLDVKGLSSAEAKGLLEYFARSGLVQEQITESKVAEYRALSGGGLVGELARLGRRVRA